MTFFKTKTTNETTVDLTEFSILSQEGTQADGLAFIKLCDDTGEITQVVQVICTTAQCDVFAKYSSTDRKFTKEEVANIVRKEQEKSEEVLKEVVEKKGESKETIDVKSVEVVEKKNTPSVFVKPITKLPPSEAKEGETYDTCPAANTYDYQHDPDVGEEGRRKHCSPNKVRAILKMVLRWKVVMHSPEEQKRVGNTFKKYIEYHLPRQFDVKRETILRIICCHSYHSITEPYKQDISDLIHHIIHHSKEHKNVSVRGLPSAIKQEYLN